MKQSSPRNGLLLWLKEEPHIVTPYFMVRQFNATQDKIGSINSVRATAADQPVALSFAG
jgi:hypothetical protein